ncbi:MAG: AraC family transcriptional regulator [Methylococcales bacterium]
MNKNQLARAKRWSISSDDLPLQVETQKNCIQQTLPEDLGNGRTNFFQLEEGLSYIETLYLPSKDVAILSQIECQEPRIVITLGLKGNSRFSGNQGDEVVFKEGYTAITTFNSSIGEREYDANKAVSQLRLSITKNWLESNLGENLCQPFFSKRRIQQLSCQPISHIGIMAAEQLLTGNISNNVKRMFMQGQVMSLLAAELSHLCEENPGSMVRFNQKDREVAMLARDILYQEFKNPPSIALLSKRVGTNQFKLKKLFHHFFNNTPYGLLLEIRMNKAYRLLESTRCHVGIAADLVGYSHASNFSTAFINYFGISPKFICKKSK